MTGHLLTLLQSAVEYGALSGSAARKLRSQPVFTWASDHAVLLLCVAAAVLLVGMATRARRS